MVGPERGTWERQIQKIIEPKGKYKAQNDRIGKIHRFKRSLDPFALNNRMKSRNWETNLFLLLGLVVFWINNGPQPGISLGADEQDIVNYCPSISKQVTDN